MRYQLMYTRKVLVMLEILPLLLVSMCIINWFKGSFFIKTLDSFFGFNHGVKAYYARFMWNDMRGFGIAFPGQNTLPLHEFLNALFTAFGLITGQKIAFCLFVFFSMFSFWIFLYSIISKGSSLTYSVARILASIFYSFNPFSMSFFWWHHTLLIIFWIAFPILFLIFMKILTIDSHKYWKYCILLALLFSIFAPGLNLVFISILVYAFLLYLILLIVIGKVHLKAVIKRLLLCTITILLSNLWYILPLITTTDEQIITARWGEVSKDISVTIFKSYSRYTTLLNVIRLLGLPAIYKKYLMDYYYNWAPVYLHNQFMILITFIAPLLAISSIILTRSKDERKIISMFMCVLVLNLFIQKQGAPPFEFINYQLLKLPFGDVFRSAYDKFAIVTIFSYSILFYFSIKEILLRLERMKILRLVAVFILAGIFTLYTYPFWTGDVIYDGGRIVPAHRVIIPKEYDEFREFMNNININKTFVRIAVLPTTWWGEAAYKWEKGIQPNSDPLLQYFLEPKYSIIQFKRSNYYGNRIIEELESYLKPYNENLTMFISTLAFFGTEYIVFHRDWDGDFIRYLPSTKYYESMLNGYTYLKMLNGSPCWYFSKTHAFVEFKNIWKSSSPRRFHLEVMVFPNLTDHKQLTVSLGGFGIYLTERDEVYLSFYTLKGYRYTSPIRVDYIKSGIPLKIEVYYDAESNNLRLAVNDVVYDVKVHPEASIAPLKIIRNAIRIGTDDVNQYKGCVFYVKLSYDNVSIAVSPSSSQNAILKNVDVILFKISNIPLIKKMFENKKIVIYRISDYIPVIAVLDGVNVTVKEWYRINPTLWKVSIYSNAAKPFILRFAQAYDPHWTAEIYDRNGTLLNRVKPHLMNSIMEFKIRARGNLTIVIRYALQDWFELGLKISATTFALCIIYLVWDWRRGRGDRWALWLEERLRAVGGRFRDVWGRGFSMVLG